MSHHITLLPFQLFVCRYIKWSKWDRWQQNLPTHFKASIDLNLEMHWQAIHSSKKDLTSRFNFLQDRLSGSFKMSNKLISTAKNSKAYWSILKNILSNKKIPHIPTLFYENRFIIDFKEKADLFNSFFADQLSLLINASKLPSNFLLYTDNQ